MKGIYGRLLKWTLATYGIITFLIFVPLFNWAYITNHSYARWGGSGVYHSTARALAWPVFIRDLRESPLGSVKRSFELFQRSTVGLPKDPRNFTPENLKQVAVAFDRALQEAKWVDCGFLNQTYPEMGDHFAREFVKGLELSRDGINAHNLVEMIRGFQTLERFAEWYTINAPGIAEAV